jgi:hypothetical protein
MVVAFDSGEHLFDVIEAPDEAVAEIEAFCPETAGAGGRFVERFETRAKRIVNGGFQRPSAPLHETLEPRRDIIIQCQRRSHIMMLRL